MGVGKGISLGSTPASPVTSTGSMPKLQQTRSKVRGTAEKMLDDRTQKHSENTDMFITEKTDREIHGTLFRVYPVL